MECSTAQTDRQGSPSANVCDQEVQRPPDPGLVAAHPDEDPMALATGNEAHAGMQCSTAQTDRQGSPSANVCDQEVQRPPDPGLVAAHPDEDAVALATRKVALLEKQLKEARHVLRTLERQTHSHEKSHVEQTSNARKATNWWAGPWSQLLSTQGFILGDNLLHRQTEQLGVIARHVKQAFEKGKGNVLFSRPNEAARFLALSDKDRPIGEAQQQSPASLAGPHAISFSKDEETMAALTDVLNAVRSWVARGPGGNASSSMHSIEIMDVGFKRVPGLATTAVHTAGRRSAKNSKTSGARAESVGEAQRIHIDVTDQVAEVIVVLTNDFCVTNIPDIPPHLRKCTSRQPLANRRALAALRLAEAGRCEARVHPNGRSVLQIGDVLMIDASQPHGGPGPAEDERLGMYFNVRTTNQDQALFFGRFTVEHGVYENFWRPHKDTPDSAPARGVRTLLQQALDEHPPKPRHLREKKKGWKPLEITSRPPLTAQEANLIHLLYGKEAHKQDQDKGSSWARHIYAGVAAPWDDLMSKLTLKATWKQNPHGEWLPVYHITDGKPQKQPQKRAQPAFDPEVEDQVWRDLTEACGHPPQKMPTNKPRASPSGW